MLIALATLSAFRTSRKVVTTPSDLSEAATISNLIAALNNFVSMVSWKIDANTEDWLSI